MRSPDKDVRQKLERNIEMKNDRYEVGLPGDNEVDLANNKELATKRLQQLTRKLLSDPLLMNTYDHTVRRYTSDGHADKLIQTADNGRSDIAHYLPHRAGIQEDKTTTKARVVFRASSYTGNFKSLNENMKCGSNLNPHFVALLLKFRQLRITIEISESHFWPDFMISQCWIRKDA